MHATPLQSEDGAQVTEAMKLQRANVFSMSALHKNLDELEYFLSENELTSHLPFIR